MNFIILCMPVILLCLCVFSPGCYLSITAYLVAFCSRELQYSLTRMTVHFGLSLFFSSDIDPPTQPVSPTVGQLIQQSLPMQYIIIGGVAGGIVLLVIVIVTIIIITAIHVRRRRSMRSEYNVIMLNIIIYLVLH